jgi:hypothetical protein
MSFVCNRLNTHLANLRIRMPKAVSRDLALRAVPFMCLFNASQLRICVLPRVVHSHARAKRHLIRSFFFKSVSDADIRDENTVAHSDRVDEAGILICGAQQGRLICASLSRLCLLGFTLELC